MVVDALFAADEPVTAEELARSAGADLGSVYRNLEALEAAGIARHVHLGHAAGRYVLSGRHDGGYAACERCGKHVPLDDLEALRARRPRPLRLRVRLRALPARGRLPGLRGAPMIDDSIDDALAGLFQGAPLVVALGIAFLLGLRHATDPDHLMAVTVAGRQGPDAAPAPPRASARSGAPATPPRCS